MADFTLSEKIGAVEIIIGWVQTHTGTEDDPLREITVLQAVLADLRGRDEFLEQVQHLVNMANVAWKRQADEVSRAGAEEMRERAAQYLDDSAEKHETAAKRYNLTRSDTIAEQQRKDARTIRALPVEGVRG